MGKDSLIVPFGFEPEEETRKGTLLAYDDFASVNPMELAFLFRFASERNFARIVLYLIHEETARRMGDRELEAYHKRLARLQEAMEEAEQAPGHKIKAVLDQWEGKRKKYTPVETALDFLTEKYKGPWFVWMPERLAVKWAGFASFPQWIRQVRLVVASPQGSGIPPILEPYQSRWEYAEP